MKNLKMAIAVTLCTIAQSPKNIGTLVGQRKLITDYKK